MNDQPVSIEEMRVYVIEDHDFMRMELTRRINAAPRCSVCGSARTAERGLQDVATVKPDLITVDVSLPDMSGIDFVRALRDAGSDCRCLMISGHGEPRYVRQAFEAGADGYLLKGSASELDLAIRSFCEGVNYTSSQLAHLIPDDIA